MSALLKVMGGALVGGIGYHFIGKVKGSASKYKARRMVQHSVPGFVPDSIVLIGPQFGTMRFDPTLKRGDSEYVIFLEQLINEANAGNPKAIKLLNDAGVK